MSVNLSDVAVRALKTFGQAFVAFLLANALNFTHLTSVSSAEKLLFAGVVGAVSVVWNVVLVPLWTPVQKALFSN